MPSAFFVGEAPGPDEDRQGRPFIGRAGKILRASLEATGWGAEESWITNSVKCFPHTRVEGSARIRAPTDAERDACRPHLAAEVQKLRPRLLVALGRTAARELTGADVPNLSAVHGTVVRARPEYAGAPVLLTFHPSGLHYERGRRQLFEEDLQRARRLWSEGAAAP